MFVKLCGLRTTADVTTAIEAGADAVGFVLTKSPRQIEAREAHHLAAAVPDHVLTVVVVHGIPAAEAGELARQAGVQALQLHGDYPREAFEELAGQPFQLLRATALGPETDVRTGAFGEAMLLIDSPVAGSGERWDISKLDEHRPEGRWLLAGGLSPANVAQAIERAKPWGVDVSSGIESSRGVKDHGLMREFTAIAKG